ncbi:hypothetical protein [Acinetobacter sp. 197]|uniref:hypothetical protein n=1 Tax=Acinetobacter sp. 197 TaxID=3114696 RepID=UPI003A88CB15
MISKKISDGYSEVRREFDKDPDILYLSNSARTLLNQEIPETLKTGDCVGFYFSKEIYAVNMQEDFMWFNRKHLKSALEEFDKKSTLYDISDDFEIEITIPKSRMTMNGHPIGNQIEKKVLLKIPVQVLYHFKTL